MTTTLTVGQRITAGSGDDRDSGTIDRIDGDQVTVRWDQGIVTTQPTAALVGDEQDDDDDCRLTDAYRVRNDHQGGVLSLHQTYRQARDAMLAALANPFLRDQLTIEELVDGQWVTAS